MKTCNWLHDCRYGIIPLDGPLSSVSQAITGSQVELRLSYECLEIQEGHIKMGRALHVDCTTDPTKVNMQDPYPSGLHSSNMDSERSSYEPEHVSS